ncbi:MAG TPA: YiiX/YebB-like N1pC/P60 family cysteine hydrolase, partial [Polyangiaceae bacterium]
NVEREGGLLAGAIDALGANDRKKIRELWWQVFEPIVAIDDIKHRYEGWYGIDYVEHPLLHARGFALAFTALCAQVDAGLRLLRAVSDRPLAAKLWNEAMPELGLPARTFDALRSRSGRARDLFYVPIGAQWFDAWMRRPLALDAKLASFLAFVEAVRGRALKRVITPTTSGVENKVDVVKSELFQQWFPLQKGVAEWAGDTRLAKEGRRLVSDAQLHDFRQKLRPADIILERRNWYISNVGLPGFWPHAALYTGTQREILDGLGKDPAVVAAYGDLAGYLAKKYPKAWASLAERDEGGREHVIVEAVSEGVVSASIEHSCGADYVAALRPRLEPLARARALERTLSVWGRPYDFDFDFATDDQVVCSELVLKAFEPTEGDGKGLAIPFVEIAGRRAVPPTEFVRVFANERDRPDARFDFVHFLDGLEKEHRAVVADAAALAATVTRPKWDIVQP